MDGPVVLDLPDASEQPGVQGLLPVQSLFLEYYCVHGLITSAAAAVGIPQRLVKQWRRDDSAFATALEDADEVYHDVVRREVRRRAIDGWDEPVYQRGVEVGTVRRYSDGLLVKLAQSLLPEFKEQDASVTVNNTMAFVPWVAAATEQQGATEDTRSGNADQPSNPAIWSAANGWITPAALPAPPETTGGNASPGTDAKLEGN